MSYFDLDHFQSEEQSVPIRLTVRMKRPLLDPSTADGHYEPDSVVPVPLWLAVHLQRHGLALLCLPKQYGPVIREEVRAGGGEGLPLGELAPNFYLTGARLSQM